MKFVCLAWLLLANMDGLTIDAMAASALPEIVRQLQAGQFTEAAQKLEALARHDSKNAEVWNLLGIARGELHQMQAADLAFRNGLSVQPDSPALNENFGLLLFRDKQYERAKRYLKKGSARPDVRFSLAAAELRTGETEAARNALAGLETELSGSGDYWLERGRADVALDATTAEHEFQKAAELLPKPAPAWDEAAGAAERQGLDEKALAYLIQARAAEPDNPEILMHFGAVCIRRDLGPDALSALEQARRLQPQNGEVLFLLARAHIGVQNWQQALQELRLYAKDRPDYHAVHFAEAWVELRLNERVQARRDLDRVLADLPRYTDARCERASMEIEDGDLNTAASDIAAALSAEPDNPRANLLAGDLQQRQDRLHDAEMSYERALRGDPDSIAAHYKLAGVLTRLGMSARAGEERAQAARLAEAQKEAAHTQLRLVLPDPQHANNSVRKNK